MFEFEGSHRVFHDRDRARFDEFERRPEQRFDRLAFALRAAILLSPNQTRVAVFRSRRLHVSHGIDLGRGPRARWVMVGIPGDASAKSIVLALAKLGRRPAQPFALDATMQAALEAILSN